MFIYSIRASTIKFFLLIGATLALLILIINIGDGSAVYASVDGLKVNYGGMNTNEDRVGFIESLGIMVKDAPVSDEVFTAPDSFDRILAGYNEVQKAQGLDLTKYRGKRITHYAYEVENFDYEGKVYANLYVYKGRIVGCDISSLDGGGLLSPLVGVDETKLK